MTKRRDINILEIGELAPKRGNWITAAIGRTLFWLFGWKFEGEIPNIAKCIVVGAPHTSNWDFPLAMAAIYGLGIDISWLGKHTFVNGSMGWLWRRMGGIPVDRHVASGVVGQSVDQFNGRSQFFLGVSPEGSRSKIKEWKLGFYYIAKNANVPILALTLDYGRKRVGFMPLIEPGDDADAVLAEVKAVFKNVVGKNPHSFSLGAEDN